MRKQRGVTAIGWVFLLIPMALTLYAGIRVGPVYLNYWRVIDAMQKTASEFKGEDTINPVQVKNALAKRFDIGYVEGIDSTEIDVHKGGDGWQMSTEYEGVAPLFGNMSIVIAFNKTFVIK